jgi:hypothetical protein
MVQTSRHAWDRNSRAAADVSAAIREGMHIMTARRKHEYEWVSESAPGTARETERESRGKVAYALGTFSSDARIECVGGER